MLKTLYFLRHGLAEVREEWSEDDALRPLTSKGKKNLVRSVKTISDLDLGIDLILTSPLVRAFQTAEIVADELGIEKRLVKDDRLEPGFNLELLSEMLKEHTDADEVLLVGHEPDFSQTVSALISGGIVVFKKGGLARVDITSIDPLQGELAWLLPPKLLIR